MARADSDFQQFITDARERKKNEALADRIFSRNRRQSAPSSRPHPSSGGRFMASRSGVNKRASSGSWRQTKLDLDSEWTHDLHETINNSPQNSPRPSASRRRFATQRHGILASAMDKMDVDQLNVRRGNTPTGPRAMGMSIKGLAGSVCVVAENFAPGTTAADIESAMTPVGGEMVRCIMVKTTPFLQAEMYFSSREGAERVIDTFNDRTADGRILKVYFKTDDHSQQQESTRTFRAKRDDYERNRSVDSFRNRNYDDDLMEPQDDNYSNGFGRPLYSDKIAGRNRHSRDYYRRGD
ncbi:pentatricopeptide repeat protein [Ophiocordyceps camponoti-floridani]|uniref:Pentatricopeptide repeat protein n=1 Tax=Ophiocordyceps camponoti-floridani TaxID=2030778 RepID=A0A8H4Q3Q8_9HYPO|nr:pentatricopeptide repeat protein [Ophiocordyceps camponoti-floridani]